MKKICAFILVLVMSISFASCGSDRKEDASSFDDVSSSGSGDEVMSSDEETSSREESSSHEKSSGHSESSATVTGGFKAMSDEELTEYVNEKADDALSEVVTNGMTEIEKLKSAYKWLFHHFKYKAITVDLSNGYNDRLTLELAAEFFKRHRGSCEHYAAAQKILFERLGYNPVYVEGERFDSGTGTYGDHVWLMIEIDGKNYHVDGLFGGNHTSNILSMFCVPDSELESTHKWDKLKYPSCDSEQLL